ncbi:MAG: IPT/TIG domain-containing protein [Verrucomicrobia bacterium]|nr:IPT/TIG domain-containing protein [Verrucomicrobiota bacterium]
MNFEATAASPGPWKVAGEPPALQFTGLWIGSKVLSRLPESWPAFALGILLILPPTVAASTTRPIINSFFPASGAPGASVVIAGSNFAAVNEVRFNTDVALFTVISPSRIIATVPLEATSGPISVSTSVGAAVTFAHFIVAPRVTDFEPTNAAPGTVVIIGGANFTGATSVQFNGKTAASFSVTGQNQIHATVPNGATSGPISVTTRAGTGTSIDSFIVTGTEPIIADFSPANGVAGTVVTVEGRAFLGATAVKFNGTNAASFFVTAPTQLNAVVPAGATTGPISVTTISGTGFSAKPFVVTLAPLIAGFEPAAGPPGTTVLIEGANFLGATAVRFNGVNAASFSAPAPTQISATVPQGAATGPVSVTTPKGTGASLTPFVVTTSPLIREFSPTNGPAGTIVTIDGVNFSGLTAVKFGTANATKFALVSPTQIQATVPAGASTGPISVITSQGTGVSTYDFLVTAEQPVLTGFSPAAGAPGMTVILHGLNFAGATSVKFSGLGANFAVTAPTQITCTIPPGALSGPVSVTTPAGTAVSPSPFIVAPRITSFSPTNGVFETPVLIRGTNFTQVLAVRFNGVLAGFTNPSPNEIAALVPANATTGPISVTTPAGIVGSTNAFVVLPELLGPVRLNVERAATNQIVLSWPAAAWRFELQWSERLAPPSWSGVTNRPVVLGDRRTVKLGIGNRDRFFRLHRP